MKKLHACWRYFKNYCFLLKCVRYVEHMLTSFWFMGFASNWYHPSLKPDSHRSNKIFFICFSESHLKMMKNAFHFICKALFALSITEFLSWLFGHIEKAAWLEKWGQFQNLLRHGLVNKELQYIYAQYLTK